MQVPYNYNFEGGNNKNQLLCVWMSSENRILRLQLLSEEYIYLFL